MDISEYQNMLRQAYNITDLNLPWTFFYDETNNARKFRLVEGGFNTSEDANFVLGGIMYTQNQSNADINELFEKLRLPKTIKEIKFKHIADGGFVECLSSTKLKIILEWLLQSDLYIHYSTVNVLYYSLVDIIDTLIIDALDGPFIHHNFINELKNKLYEAVISDKERVVKLLFDFEYPNIKKESLEQFVDALMEFLDEFAENMYSHVWVKSITQMLKQVKSKSELSFLSMETDHLLIPDYSHFYVRPLMVFNASTHIFDNEDHIKRLMKEMDLDLPKDAGFYRFEDSKENKYIQLSDVVVGILGKCFTFVNSVPISKIKKVHEELNAFQLENLKLLDDVITKSDQFNKALLHSSTSLHEKNRLNLLFEL
ncbi:DUF3800 domain-containing protein [Cohnella lubricantis]|uniref:DUF3800 domain-containing protein n=1 Tax=Cohnella lubricantis TaxID=2163172 RepID=A0A841TIL7_9BACL|nr:DUF3800 domain-containing protein [Cohnella lubricantis]MBB6678331.1 DUF3800 domain-containing protein [Cohnella lubricantis]MBP2120619.1 hypothetical protein [Cohnella lubricantis]